MLMISLIISNARTWLPMATSPHRFGMCLNTASERERTTSWKVGKIDWLIDWFIYWLLYGTSAQKGYWCQETLLNKIWSRFVDKYNCVWRNANWPASWHISTKTYQWQWKCGCSLTSCPERKVGRKYHNKDAARWTRTVDLQKLNLTSKRYLRSTKNRKGAGSANSGA